MWQQVIFNLFMLVPLAKYDLKTCRAPKTATLAFVLVSLCFTSPFNALGAIFIAGVMYTGMKILWIGNADKKILFGLALQYGFILPSAIYALIGIVVYYIRKKNPDYGMIPLIPVILVGYVGYLIIDML
jgi:apolipoprotein N-acyltransferase